LNGPPTGPDDVKPVAGVTLMGPAVLVEETVRLTDRVESPVPFVRFVKVTVSE
jgi:hypothetical protein